MSKKSYLSQQIQLITLTTVDLFTQQEYDAYMRIVELMNEVSRIDLAAKKNKTRPDKARKAELLAEKKIAQKNLETIIRAHLGRPRTVRLQGVLDQRRCPEDGNGHTLWPPGITWDTLRNSRKIAEFCSDMSRQMGLNANDITFDKIIIKWKSPDVLEQIIKDGFLVPILLDSGEVENRAYRVLSASAGQLRTDKLQAISNTMWEKIRDNYECGLSWEEINARGGLNVSKQLAYSSLASGATDPWPEMDLDHVIVIDDYEDDVTDVMDFIHPDYTIARGEYTFPVKHTDGWGMVRPDVSSAACMIRGKYIKGLISPFDFLRFCRANDAEPVLTDIWGVKHDLIAEDIWMILTKSQFKLWKYYDSWDSYKEICRKTGSGFSRTNYEERWIPDTTTNYQFLQTLVDMTDEEIDRLTQKTFERIHNMATDVDAMLRTLRADEYSDVPYKRALGLYPALLRDGYSRETLKAIKRRWTLDAQSGRLLLAMKRLFVIPDAYAACERWFLREEHPKGLLAKDEVACRVYRNFDKVDCLRSPSLYMEHAVRRVSHDPEVYRWFPGNVIVTSNHDCVSKILQFDCDGDMLNVSPDEVLVNAAERNIEEYDIKPLLYDANSAPAEYLDNESLFVGVKRAHDASGIGQVSNNLCKLWNSDSPDFDAAKLLCYYNNQVNHQPLNTAMCY